MKISIVTVTLNAEKFLHEAIASVKSQDYENYEHIVVDGCSSDRTVEIAGEFAASDSRFRLFVGTDTGIADAMNRGGSLATGEIIAFLHADDYYAHNQVLSCVATVFSTHPETVWCTGGLRLVGAAGNKMADLRPYRYSYRRLLRGNIIYHPSTFVRREALEAVGWFSPELHYAMDYDLWLRLGSLHPPVVVPSGLSCFRVHSGSTSSRHAVETFCEEWEVRKRYLAPGSLSYLLHYGYFQFKKALHLKKRHVI